MSLSSALLETYNETKETNKNQKKSTSKVIIFLKYFLYTSACMEKQCLDVQ